jgi:thiol:disulfide interchange protein DsbA
VNQEGKKNRIDPRRRALAAALGAAPLVLPFASFAQQGNFIEIKPPVPVDSAPGKVEVIEFFWYGCIHCYNLEPRLETWLKKLPSDAEFKRIPAVFNARWAADAATFYAFEAMGVLPKVHRAFFDAIHRDHLDTSNRAALDEWLGKNGLDARKYEETVKSFGVQSKVRRASQLTVASKIDGTPALTVQGRYMIGGSDQMLDTASKLIDTVRQQK